MFLLLFDWFRWVIFRIFPHYCWHCCVQSGPVTVSYRWQETADSDNQLSSVRQPGQTCCDALSDYSCSSVTFLMILSHASWEIITLTAIALITLKCKVSWLSSTLCFWQFWMGCFNRPFYSEDIVILTAPCKRIMHYFHSIFMTEKSIDHWSRIFVCKFMECMWNSNAF